MATFCRVKKKNQLCLFYISIVFPMKIAAYFMQSSINSYNKY